MKINYETEFKYIQGKFFKFKYIRVYLKEFRLSSIFKYFQGRYGPCIKTLSPSNYDHKGIWQKKINYFKLPTLPVLYVLYPKPQFQVSHGVFNITPPEGKAVFRRMHTKQANKKVVGCVHGAE